MFPLEKHRLRGKRFEYFKIPYDFNNVHEYKLFMIENTSRTKGNSAKFINSDYTKFIIINFIVGTWNKFPSSVAECNTIDLMINKFTRHSHLLNVHM